MFKTMWNMPAKLLRLGDDDTPGVRAPIASGSLEDMIRAADDHAGDADAGSGHLIIQCAGRDRPISWSEIQGLRQSMSQPADA